MTVTCLMKSGYSLIQVLKRFWRVTITMLVAACLALVRGVNDFCHVDPEDLDGPEECEIPGGGSRWAGAPQRVEKWPRDGGGR